MKIAALFTIEVCALFVCHATANTGLRPKRTLKFFENFMDTMRVALGPAPPDLPPPEVIAKIATLPYSNPYTYFPTVRMHIRPMDPVEKHIVYVKTLPPPPSSSLVLKPNLNDVEIIRMIQPLVRRPKSNSANIHYEIIPITIPIQEVRAPVNHSPLSGDREFENEDAAFPGMPWTMDALPPPMPTSKPLDSGDEHIVPWQLQALPPPVATKRPSWQPILKPLTSNDNEVFYPMKKKIMIPAKSEKQSRANFFHDKFMPSPLQSEISVQPSLELTAFSETDSMTGPPISNFRVRRVFDKRINPKSRSKRDTWANSPIHAELSTAKPKGRMTSVIKPAVQIKNYQYVPSNLAPSTLTSFDAKKFSEEPFYSETLNTANKDSVKMTNKYKDSSTKVKLSGRGQANIPPSTMEDVEVPTTFDFGEYSDNEEADREDSKSALSEKHGRRMNFTDDVVSIVKSHDILSDRPIHHEYIPVTNRPNPSTFSGTTNNNFSSRKLSSSLFSTPVSDTKRQFNLPSPRTSLKNKQSEESERLRPNKYIDFFSSPKEDKSKTDYFSKPSSKDAYDDLFGEPEKDTKEQYFEHAPKHDFAKPERHYVFNKSVKSPQFDHDKSLYNDFEKSPTYDYDKTLLESDWSKNEKQNKQHSGYGNIEYFEPVVIDIDSGEPFANFLSKFKPKLKHKNKSADENNLNSEPLKLPDSLHETVDFIKTKSAHPPTFDLMSEANQYTAVAMIEENEVR